MIALTKVDLVDDDVPSPSARREIADRVAGTFLAGAPIVPVAAPLGRGLDELRAALDHLVAARRPGRRPRPARACGSIGSSPRRGAGTVVTGTSLDGTFAVGDTVEVGHRRRPARIRAIQTHGEAVDRIGPGHRAALNLRGVEVGDVARGDAVVDRARTGPPPSSTPRSTCSTPSTTRCRAGALTSPTSARASIP